jgi:hypothetical protein
MQHSVRISTPMLLILTCLIFACTKQRSPEPFFPGEYPGEVSGRITSNNLILSNKALIAEWRIADNSVYLNNVTNYYDGQTVNLANVILFAIELDGGKRLTNLDFKLKSDPFVTDLKASHTLPTKALQFPGKEISAFLVADDNNLEIRWKAQLRNGSNYIRQNIQITAVNQSVKVSRVIFFDGTLEGAKYSGMVIGSPILYKNFFFGLEHPIALSKALIAHNIGSVTGKNIDVSDIIDGPGDYIISIELGSSSESFDLTSVSLICNGKVVTCDSHSLIGEGGGSMYHLKLDNYQSGAKYEVRADIINTPAANGDFHICRKTSGLLNFYVNRTDELVPGKSISEWSVIGVAPEGQERRSFLYYIERERAHPYKQFLHYNCWWDITTDGADSFTSDQLIERMNAWNEKLIKPFGVRLQSFVFDDGWDNLDSVWYFDPLKFPSGFAPEAELCKKFNSGIGVWMSPFGGYGSSKQKRIESGHRQGLETNKKGLSLAGPNYYKRFLDRALDMLDNYKVNYFKFDGFGGSEPEYLPDMEAGARLIEKLREHNPDVFINITVGSWPSPFWLKFADCTWRGSGDLHMAGKGSRTARFMTYRDGTLYNNIVCKAPYYPLNSIMVVGIAYANLGLPEMCINDSISDFRDMVWSFFGGGSALQELYISHDRMKDEFWPILAEAAKWAKSNEDVLDDTHWIGGSPINLEVYGFGSWTPHKSVITLRNPDDKPVIFKFIPDKILEIPSDYKGSFYLKNVLKDPQGQAILKIASGDTFSLGFGPFETIILELIPDR